MEYKLRRRQFWKEKVIDLINSHLQAHGEILSCIEIEAQQKSKRALVKSIECAYKNKYHKNLYCTISKKKADISLNLMESRIRRISPGKKIGKPTEIEKVLNEAFKMIPIWK